MNPLQNIVPQICISSGAGKFISVLSTVFCSSSIYGYPFVLTVIIWSINVYWVYLHWTAKLTRWHFDKNEPGRTDNVFRYYSNMSFLGSPCTQTSDLLLLIFSLAHARTTYLRQVIKAHNKIIYTVVTTLKHLCSRKIIIRCSINKTLPP